MNKQNSAKPKAPRNRTITLSDSEIELLKQKLIRLGKSASISEVENKTICQDVYEVLKYLPHSFVDLLFIDPPYNLTKSFNGLKFRKMTIAKYASWIDTWLPEMIKTLKPTASIYICGDWQSTPAIHQIAEKYLNVRNRITWEREKGRGAEHNWKNCSEDMLFCTLSNKYTFNVESVKLKRRVIAPYTSNGKPKGWQRTELGNFRITYPSNIWNDITVPYWSMPEKTDHPTQKPEKLLAKIILASSNAGDLILDPFLGSGTTSAVAKKLNRRYVGIEIDEFYCYLAEKRLAMAENDKRIQGYDDGIFWERNTLAYRKHTASISQPLIKLL